MKDGVNKDLLDRPRWYWRCTTSQRFSTRLPRHSHFLQNFIATAHHVVKLHMRWWHMVDHLIVMSTFDGPSYSKYAPPAPHLECINPQIFSGHNCPCFYSRKIYYLKYDSFGNDKCCYFYEIWSCKFSLVSLNDKYVYTRTPFPHWGRQIPWIAT